jgi:ATP-dependent Clp protease ATP-binding subunit ClpA
LFGKLSGGGEVHVTVKDGQPSFELTPAPPKVKAAKKKPAAKKAKPAPEASEDADTGEG